MRFWDSSALVPLVVREPTTSWAQALLTADPAVLSWALSPVEVRSALARRGRDGTLSTSRFDQACARADRLFAAVSHVVSLDAVVERAQRLLNLHDLRAADALQLAAALVACEERPRSLPFVTLDGRLAASAQREGFVVETAP